MSLAAGIIGLPNVGKSTLFNALVKGHQAAVNNYAFCTIEPNIGMVEVPDDRMQQLAHVIPTEKIVPATVRFVDVAGLVRGASKGEGLGNQFLAAIRQVDVICQVVRLFADDNVSHVHGKLDPKEDREVIEAELALADLSTVEKRLSKVEPKTHGNDKEAVAHTAVLRQLLEALKAGKPARSVALNEREEPFREELALLTSKPTLYVANISEADVQKYEKEPDLLAEQLGLPKGTAVMPLSAKIESELLDLPAEEQASYLAELGLKEPGMHRLIREAYHLLGLITFFTAGPKEIKAWTVMKGATAPQAAGKIHTDFEKGFIKAEVVSWQQLLAQGGWLGAKSAGQIRLEGKEYITQDGDVMIFRFNKS